MTLHLLLVFAGLFHFVLLPVSLAVPRVLDWNRRLAPLDPLCRQVIWVHAAFIFGLIVAFGGLTLGTADTMAAGTEPGRTLAGLIGAFWLARLLTQLVYYDPRHWPAVWWSRLGRLALTALFTYWTAVYGTAFAAAGR